MAQIANIDKQTTFVCIEYPGIVENETRMLETLGGETSVTKTFLDPSRRMELRWRPEDVFCKPACGDRTKTMNMLMRVRRRKRKHPLAPDGGQKTKKPCTSQPEKSGDTAEEFEYDTKILGIVDTTYKFQGMADFQYLPMEKSLDNTYKSTAEQLVIKDIESSAWLHGESPLFLPPSIFSRLDIPQEYAYRDDPVHREGYIDPMKEKPADLIGIARQRRPHYTLFVNFDDEIPTEPMKNAKEKLLPKIKIPENMEKLKKLFEERPIWSRLALKAHINMPHDNFKIMLPLVSYFWANGPWRSFWTRLGYDPRKDVKSKELQLFDFRIRQKSIAEKLKISSKRSTLSYNLPNTVTKPTSQAAMIQQQYLTHRGLGMQMESVPERVNPHVYRPGMVPPYRQIFYQYCDVHIPEIQQLVHCNDGKETECTEKDGWCKPNIHDKCRLILARYIREAVGDTSEPEPEMFKEPKGKASARARPKSSRKKTTLTDMSVAAADSDSQQEDWDEDGEFGDLSDMLKDYGV